MRSNTSLLVGIIFMDCIVDARHPNYNLKENLKIESLNSKHQPLTSNPYPITYKLNTNI